MNETMASDVGSQALRAVSALRSEIAKALIGQNTIIDQVLIALLAGGHVLIEGVRAWARRCWSGRWPRPSTGASPASSSLPTSCPRT